MQYCTIILLIRPLCLNYHGMLFKDTFDYVSPCSALRGWLWYVQIQPALNFNKTFYLYKFRPHTRFQEWMCTMSKQSVREACRRWRKEDKIVVWFRVRKWACEEERRKRTFLICAQQAAHFIIQVAIQASSIHFMFELQEPLLVHKWISCWVTTVLETHITRFFTKISYVASQIK